MSPGAGLPARSASLAARRPHHPWLKLFALLVGLVVADARPVARLMWRCRGPARTGRTSSATYCPAPASPRSALMAMVAVATTVAGVASAWMVVAYEFPFRRTLAWALVLPLAVPSYLAAYAFGEFFEYLRAGAGAGAGDVRLPQRARLLVPRHPLDIRAARWCCRRCSTLCLPHHAHRLPDAGPQHRRRGAHAGARPAKVFWRVLLPVARPAIIAGVALVLMETINDIGAAEYLGVRTLTVAVYQTWLARGSLEAARRSR